VLFRSIQKTIRKNLDLGRVRETVRLARSEGLDVRFENGVLTLQGRVDPREHGKARCLLREYLVGDFNRSFRVGEAVEAGRITAEYRDGVAILHLPRAKEARPRRIKVKTA